MVDFKKMRDEAARELQSLVRERAQLDRKIIGLEQTIKGLDAVCNTSADTLIEKREMEPLPLPPEFEGLLALGLTDAIRKLFQNSGILLLTPTGIRDQLVMYGYELPKDNPLAAIHAVLRRLDNNGEIAERSVADGTRGYRWLSDLERTIRKSGGLYPDTQQLEQVARIGARDLARNPAGRKRLDYMGGTEKK